MMSKVALLGEWAQDSSLNVKLFEIQPLEDSTLIRGGSQGIEIFQKFLKKHGYKDCHLTLGGGKCAQAAVLGSSSLTSRYLPDQVIIDKSQFSNGELTNNLALDIIKGGRWVAKAEGDRGLEIFFQQKVLMLRL